MKKALWTNTLREIKGSFGRYMAILAIVGLGVGFYAGLSVTRDAMLETGDEYFTENRFYDLRLISTLGLKEKDVSAVKSLPFVTEAEGAYSADVLLNIGGAGDSAKVLSLSERINVPVVTAGRLPQDPSECLLDDLWGSEDMIGTKVSVSEANKEGTLDLFKVREFTVTGLCRTVLYVNYERGATSIGDGTLPGFVYVMPEAFDGEYFTEIYALTDAKGKIYTDVYNDTIEEQEEAAGDLLETLAGERYHELHDEGSGKISDAEIEISDAEEKLADGKKKIADAESDIADAEKEIADAEADIADGEREIEEHEQEIADAEKKIKDGEKEIADAEKQIADGERELADGEAELLEAEEKLAEGEKEFADAEKKIADGEKEFADAVKRLEEAGREADENRKKLDEARAQIDAAILGMGLPEAYFADKIAEIEMGRQAVAAGEKEISAAWIELNDRKKELEDGKKELETHRKELEDGRKELEEGRRELEEHRKELEDGKKEIAEHKKEIEDGKKEIEEGRQKIEEAKADIEEGKKKVEDGKKDLADGKKEIEEKKAEIADAEKEIAEGKEKLADAKEEFAKLKEPDTYVLTRAMNIGYACFENDSMIVKGVSDVFPVFFFLVAALVCMTTMNRMIEEQRTQVGVMKALGYSESSIMGKYLFYSGSAALVGGTAGFFGGSYLFPKVIWTAYNIMYNMKPIKFVFNVRLSLISLAVSIICSMGATYLTLAGELRSQAADLIRPKAPANGKRVLMERVTFIWKRLSFTAKVSVRNVFRYKKRFFMMVLGVGGCYALLVTGMGLRDSITDITDNQFKKIQNLDLTVNFKENLSEEDLRKFRELLADGELTINARVKSVDLIFDGRQKSVIMTAYSDEDPAVSGKDFMNFMDVKERPIELPGPGEVIVSSTMAEDLGIRVGDEVILRDPDLKEIKAKVSAIMLNYVNNLAFISKDTYEAEMDEEFKVNTAYVRTDRDVYELGAQISDLDGVMSINITEELVNRVDNMLVSMNYVVLLTVFSSAALAFIVMYNLTNINITERLREIATLKVLGFYPKETNIYVFRENFVLTGIGIIAGFFMGIALHRYVMFNIKVDLVSFDAKIKPVSFLIAVGLTFVYAILVDFVLAGKLERIKMAESLKSVE